MPIVGAQQSGSGDDGADHRIPPHQTPPGSRGHGSVNLPAAAWLGARGQRQAGIALARPAGLARPILLAAVVVTGVSALLEVANPGNYWVLFEDLSAVVAPGAGAIAVALAASRSVPEHRPFKWVLAVALGVTAVGQLVSDVPDVFPALVGPWLRVLSEGCNVTGAIVSIVALWRTLYGRLEGEARRQALLDGLIIMAASMTFIGAAWLLGGMAPGSQADAVFAGTALGLLVPLASAVFVSTAAAAIVCALALRVEPDRRGVWAVVAGVVLIDVAWNGWFGRILSGSPDGIEPMDFIFPAGALIAAYGGLTWTLRPGGGRRYEGMPGPFPTGFRLPPSSVASSSTLCRAGARSTWIPSPSGRAWSCCLR